MNTWKLILATLVIFGTGVLTGGFVVRRASPGLPVVRPSGTNQLDTPGPGPFWMQESMRRRLHEELKLTPAQTPEFDRIMGESRQRFQILWDLVRPDMQYELRDLRTRLQRVLTADQAERLDRFTRPRMRRSDGSGNEPVRNRDRFPQATNRAPGDGNPARRNPSTRP